jgi:hypothetical protein
MVPQGGTPARRSGSAFDRSSGLPQRSSRSPARRSGPVMRLAETHGVAAIPMMGPPSGFPAIDPR